MTTIAKLLARRDKTTPGAVLADDSLNAMRYAVLRGISPKEFAALHKSVYKNHDRDESWEEAFNRLVDVIILTQAAERNQ